MSDAVKVAGLCVSGVVCFGFAVIGIAYDYPELMPFAYGFGSAFGTLLGIPVLQGIGRAIKKIAEVLVSGR